MAVRTHTTASGDRRELAARAFSRVLECAGGPCDGERKPLPADEYAIELERGRYVAIATGGAEYLEWRRD